MQRRVYLGRRAFHAARYGAVMDLRKIRYRSVD
jgi:hypothetical protein